ncbi:MAG: glycosyltransferase [Ignavibacteriae bacterium]|nr:MAG: glycosyltransferase [Ignavibacteriota bacterium]
MDEQKDQENKNAVTREEKRNEKTPPEITKTEISKPSVETQGTPPPQGERKKAQKRFYKRNGSQRRYSGSRNTPSVNLNIANKIISVVIPLYNEEESVVELSITLKKVLERMRANYEVIFIDDGSTDSSFQKIKEINHLNSKFKCIKFKRNYGKSAALSEGFKAAKGDYIITMDADLQDDPEEIPALIQKLNDGYDLVSGWKKIRHDPFIKKHTSKLFNFVTSTLVGLKLHDYNCGIKGYKKDVIKNIKIYGEMHRYIPALAHLSGYKVGEITVTHHPRKFGKTKFGTARFVNGLFDLITVLFTTKFIKKPLHFFGVIGLLNCLLGMGIIAYLTVLKFFDSVPISNRPLFLVGILLSIVGVQFISLGLIAEMITKTTTDKENVIIDKTLS